MSDKVCPFCGEQDFDAVGLKIHLNEGHCEAFNDTPGPARTVRLPLPPSKGSEAARKVCAAAKAWREARSPHVSNRAFDLFAALDEYEALDAAAGGRE